MLRYTFVDNPDHENIQQCLVEIDEITLNYDQLENKRLNIEHLVSIESRLSGNHPVCYFFLFLF